MSVHVEWVSVRPGDYFAVERVEPGTPMPDGNVTDHDALVIGDGGDVVVIEGDLSAFAEQVRKALGQEWAS